MGDFGSGVGCFSSTIFTVFGTLSGVGVTFVSTLGSEGLTSGSGVGSSGGISRGDGERSKSMLNLSARDDLVDMSSSNDISEGSLS